MISIAKELYAFRELMWMLAWKNIIVRYKQAYFGMAWAILKPVLLTLIFTVVRSFVGIESGDVPYPIMTFAALMPWILFQESAAQGVSSVVGNAALIRKIYFPREIFPITAILTKLIEFSISLIILAAMMIWYEMMPSIHALWIPVIILYTLMISLVISLVGSAMNVFYRDIVAVMPVIINLLMYASPVIYPMTLVHKKLVIEQAAGDWSAILYKIYTINPLAGIIDAFQRCVLKGLPLDLNVIWPGLIATLILLPVSYRFFKMAESKFADVI